MSNHAARPRPKPKKSIYFGFERSDLAALILAFMIGLTLLIVHLGAKDNRQDWPAVNGQVIETTAWLPVSKQSTYKAFLEFWLSQMKKQDMYSPMAA